MISEKETLIVRTQFLFNLFYFFFLFCPFLLLKQDVESRNNELANAYDYDKLEMYLDRSFATRLWLLYIQTYSDIFPFFSCLCLFVVCLCDYLSVCACQCLQVSVSVCCLCLPEILFLLVISAAWFQVHCTILYCTICCTILYCTVLHRSRSESAIKNSQSILWAKRVKERRRRKQERKEEKRGEEIHSREEVDERDF